MSPEPQPRNIKAQTRKKIRREDIVHLVLWVPEEDDVAEIDLSVDKFDDDLNLTEHGKEQLQKHLRRMYPEEEESSIPEEEEEIEF